MRIKTTKQTFVTLCAALSVLTACAPAMGPQARNVNIPAPQTADARPSAINEKPDSVIYLPLGRDILVPEAATAELLPNKQVGPFELRGETLGGALQLILDGVDIPIAFQSDQGLTTPITVTNLKGDLPDVVAQVCALANLYCSYEKKALVVKGTQTFVVALPPIGSVDERKTMLADVAKAVEAIVGKTPVLDETNRTLVYEASSRTADMAARYFQRLRANTALIVYETYIWQVNLNAGNSAGIRWSQLQDVGVFNMGITLDGSSTDANLGAPISIGLPTRGNVDFDNGDILNFISQYGAVKTISQPQLTVLSGAKAKLRVADTQNYVSEITRTVTGDQTTVSNETDSVESGFTLEIASAWDNATVYGDINILLQEVNKIEVFDNNPEAIVQLPQTTEREVKTQVRVRPGDSLLIAGLVRENDGLDKSGLGLEKPILPTSRTATTNNSELVFLLKPRVISFVETPEKYNRIPVIADTPAPDVVLEQGGAQAVLPMKAAQVIESPVADEPAPQNITPVAPDAPKVPDMPAAAQLFDGPIVAPQMNLGADEKKVEGIAPVLGGPLPLTPEPTPVKPLGDVVDTLLNSADTAPASQIAAPLPDVTGDKK